MKPCECCGSDQFPRHLFHVTLDEREVPVGVICDDAYSCLVRHGERMNLQYGSEEKP